MFVIPISYNIDTIIILMIIGGLLSKKIVELLQNSGLYLTKISEKRTFCE